MFSNKANTFFGKNNDIELTCLIIDNPFPYLPPIVELNHLYPNNKILSDETIRSVKEWFDLNQDKNILRISAIDGMPVVVLKLHLAELQQSNLYAIYLGIKPKSYQFSKRGNQQQIQNWTMYIEVSDVKNQFKYTVVDPLSGKEISDIITSDHLPIIKKLRYPYQIYELQKIAHDILKITSSRGHTYQKKILGSGGYGTVRLMQNIDTGEWCALKKMPYSKLDDPYQSYNSEKEVKVESNNLTLLNLSLGEIDESRLDSKQIKFVGMKLVPGINLSDFKKGDPSLSQMQWLNLFVSLIEYVLKFYRSGYLHLDIKPENMIYNRSTNEISFVDFGFLATGQSFKSDHSCGTEGYIPPEFDNKSRLDFKFFQYTTRPTINDLHLLDAEHAYVRFGDQLFFINKSQQLIEDIPVSSDQLNELDLLLQSVTYIYSDTLVKIRTITGHAPAFVFNEKSIVYNVGLIIAELLDLDQNCWNNSRVINDDNKRFLRSTFIKNLTLKNEILSYLKSMTSYCMDLRPNLIESLQFFKNKILKLPEIICHTRKIGILNINEYLSSNTKDQLLMQDRLKLMDEIWFIDCDQSYSDRYYQIRRELEKAEINIGNHVFSTKKKISEQKLLLSIAKQNSPDSINAYFSVTNAAYHQDKIGSYNNSGICLLFLDTKENNINKIYDYLYHNTLLNEQYKMLIYLLTNKKEQLSEKYGLHHRVANKRIANIESTINYFNQCHEKNILSHALIHESLEQLSNSLLSTSTNLIDIMQHQNAYAMSVKSNH